MAKYTENDVLNALADIQRGMAAAKAAKLWSVPRTTLRNRLRGTEPLKVAMRIANGFLLAKRNLLLNGFALKVL